MKLFTKISVEPKENQIDYTSKIVLLGSCFAENIGDKLLYYKFDTLQNPFGILFNPVSLEILVKRALNQDKFTEKDLFYHREAWRCFEVHSKISDGDKNRLLKTLNTHLEITEKYLKTATHIIFTYGTSWVYKKKDTQAIVANCHKVPQNNFEKKLLSVSESFNAIESTIQLIKKNNSKATVIFTVSPVRHIKNGIPENSLSKAHLLTAIHTFIATYSDSNFYFPSYEIMLDELRDYRFYKEDLIHPSSLAITIIWERFSQAWISSKTKEIQNEIDSIQKGLQHKPFIPDSEEHRTFQKKLQYKIEKLQKQLPWVQF